MLVGSTVALIAASAFLLASHFGIASTPLRPALVARVGEPIYRVIFTLVAGVAFTWFLLAYGAAPYAPLWDYQPWQNWVPILVLPLALLFFVGGLTTRNPTMAGMEGALKRDEPARGLLRITRHPFNWGVGLWALSHIAPNGDAGSLLLFGTIFILSVPGSILLDRKKRAAGGPEWRNFERATSFVPFAAVLDGRQSLARAAAEVGPWRMLLTVLLYGGLLHAHPHLFGVAAIPAG